MVIYFFKKKKKSFDFGVKYGAFKSRGGPDDSLRFRWIDSTDTQAHELFNAVGRKLKSVRLAAPPPPTE